VNRELAEARILDAAEALFYARGVHAVGMDEIRSTAGVSLKRLYQLFPAKDRVVEAFLRRRDGRWREKLARYADARPTPGERILAVFDWHYLWFSEPDFRGCAFVNSFAELGATHPAVAEAARAHKEAFQRYLSDLVTAADGPPDLAEQLALLAEGATTMAAISGSPEPAHRARDAARVLLSAAGTSTGPA
jgi:AcrR family transcriptional regulator